jgi:DinB superfamily
MKDLAAQLRGEVERAAERFQLWSDADASRARGDGKWVGKEILGHLIDSAFNNQQRFVRAQLASTYVGPGYEQAAWVAVNGYRERPWRELLEIWVAANRQLAAVIERVPAAKLATPCTIGDDEPVALELVMRDYLAHLKHHLEQIGSP